MHKHSWRRWPKVAFCAALLSSVVSINLSPGPAWALKAKEDDFSHDGQHPVKLEDFLEALDKITAGVKSLIDTITKDTCTNKARYDGYMLSLNNDEPQRCSVGSSFTSTSTPLLMS